MVAVDNGLFAANSDENLNNKNNPAFYELNLRELGSIDFDRVRRAVERLADSDAALLRPDISETLIELLAKPGIRCHGEIARALLKWTEHPGPAAEAALPVLKDYLLREESPPEPLVNLVATATKPEALPVIEEIWKQNPILWENQLARFGPPVEAFAAKLIDSENAPLRRSAIKLLGHVGGRENLPALKRLLENEDPEVRLLAERSIERIESR